MFSGPETTATLMVTEKQMAFRPHILTMRQCLGLTHTSEVVVLPRTCSVMEASQGTEFSLSPVPDEVYASGFRDIQDEYDPNRGQWPGTALHLPLPQAAETGEIIQPMTKARRSTCSVWTQELHLSPRSRDSVATRKAEIETIPHRR